MCIFIFRIFTVILLTAVKHIFRIFTGVLPDYFLLNSANTQNKNGILPMHKVKKEKVYN
jgi:hypothetical protein